MLLPTAVLVLLIAIHGGDMNDVETEILKNNGLYCQRLNDSWAIGVGDHYNRDNPFGGYDSSIPTTTKVGDLKTNGDGIFYEWFRAPDGCVFAGALISANKPLPKRPVVDMVMSPDKKSMFIYFDRFDIRIVYSTILYVRKTI